VVVGELARGRGGGGRLVTGVEVEEDLDVEVLRRFVDRVLRCQPVASPFFLAT
jgi:hypothetical protein